MNKSIDNNASKLGIRERFLFAYANLPLNARDEIIIVFENGPLSWKAVYFEIINNTELGNNILEKIEKLNIL